MSLAYRYPQLYDLLVRIIHGKSLEQRYKIIGEEVGEHKKVFELGCGTAMVYPFLHNSCEYEGWDLNERFLAFCRRRGITVSKKDVFDFKDYPDNDVILICDLLHHLAPNHERLVIGALERSKKVIISEPARSLKPPKMIKPLVLLSNYLVFDYDGINQLNQTLKWDYNEEKLSDFFKMLGSTKIVTVGWDMIAVFDDHNS